MQSFHYANWPRGFRPAGVLQIKAELTLVAEWCRRLLITITHIKSNVFALLVSGQRLGVL